MSKDEKNLKGLFGCFAAGVTVVTTLGPDGAARGMTVSSFSAVSLEPPIVLYCLGDHAVNFDAFAAATHFAVNILKDDQASISNRFADPSQPDWPDLPYRGLAGGSPILDGTLGALDCKQISAQRFGDHLVVLGEVIDTQGPEPGAPLIYHRGLYIS